MAEEFGIFKSFNEYYDNHSDPRTRGLWLMGKSPMCVWVITYIYFAFLYFGSLRMNDRQPFKLNRLMFIYNMVLAVLSAYMFYEIIAAALQAEYTLIGCSKYNKETVKDPKEARMANVLYLYYLSKVVELFDTVLMVLRKKNSQITFLHVFHHASMLNIWWYVAIFMPGGLAFFGPMLNCFIHTLMYSYYGLSAIPSLREKLWWKRYLTRLQLLQFFFVLLHTVGSLTITCDFPKYGQYVLSGYTIILLGLFINFYLRAYRIKPKLASEKKHLE